jgi:hypothetical protein
VVIIASVLMLPVPTVPVATAAMVDTLLTGPMGAPGVPVTHTVTVAPWTVADLTNGSAVSGTYSLWLSDNRTQASGAWPAAITPTGYIEYSLPSAVPSGTVLSVANVTLAYANQVATTTVASLEVFDGTGWTVHALPSATGTTKVTTTVSAPELASVSAANATKLRFLAANAGGAATLMDQVRIQFVSNRGTFELAPETFVDQSTGTPVSNAYDFAVVDGNTYQTRAAWPTTGYSAGNYVEFALGPVVAPGSIISSVTVQSTYVNQKRTATATAKLEVSDGSSTYTHALSTCVGDAAVSDTVALTEITDYGKLEAMAIRFYAYSPVATKTRHDALIVTVTYQPPAWMYAAGSAALGDMTVNPIVQAAWGGSNDGVVRSFSTTSGVLRWGYATGGPVQSISVVQVAGADRVFASSQDGYLYHVDDAGALIWRQPVAGDYDPGSGTFSAPGANDRLQGGVAYKSAVLVGGAAADTVFVGTYNSGASDNALYALNAADGSVRWTDTRAGSDMVNSFPCLDYTSGRAVYTTFGGHVYCLETSGTPLWDVQLGGGVSSNPTIYSGKVYVGANDGTLYILNLTDGSAVRSVTPAAGAYRLSTPWPSGGTVFVSSSKGSLYAIETSSGAVTAEAAGLNGPRRPLLVGTKIYLGTNAGLVILSKSTLAVLKGYTSGYAQSPPSMDVYTQRLFFGDSQGRFYGIDPADLGQPPFAPVPEGAPAARIAGSGAAPRAGASGAVSAPRAPVPGGGIKRRVRGRPSITVRLTRVSGQLVVTADVYSRVGSPRLAVRLLSPDGGTYARLARQLPIGRRGGRAKATWRVPVDGTWAESMPGRWRADATASSVGSGRAYVLSR